MIELITVVVNGCYINKSVLSELMLKLAFSFVTKQNVSDLHLPLCYFSHKDLNLISLHQHLEALCADHLWWKVSM